MPHHKPGVLLFDVNETLLDLAPLQHRIEEILQKPGSAKLWFATLLQHALVMTVSGQYAPFPDIGAAVLRMLARNSDIALDEEEATGALSVLRQLSPHPDVEPALRRLKQAGWRMATLTNSSLSGVQAQMEHAGLDGFFERQLSVETVGKFKPHREVYKWAAQELGTAPSSCMLVAAHGWDVAGAQWAGMQTAFIARPGQQTFPLAPGCDIDVPDLGAFANALGA